MQRMSRAQRLLTLCILLQLEVERRRRLRRPPRRVGGAYGLPTHTHTESQISDLGDYVLDAGDTMTGALTIQQPANTDALILGDATHEGNMWEQPLTFYAVQGRQRYFVIQETALIPQFLVQLQLTLILREKLQHPLLN